MKLSSEEKQLFRQSRFGWRRVENAHQEGQEVAGCFEEVVRRSVSLGEEEQDWHEMELVR